ncbi:MAG: prenyltransferase [Actinomycetia bacterium]|nr:prenyltransferase [Actinomycetes bacterium]
MAVARRDSDRYASLTPKAALQLAAPPTWVASIGPVLVGGLAALFANSASAIRVVGLTLSGSLLGILYRPALSLRGLLLWLLMLICAVAAQSAANTLNDYKDFVTGTDTEENCIDTTDASIIYNRLAPKAARNFGIACLALALVAGAGVALLSHLWLLVLGGVGIVALLSYSYGPAPVSYLPLGEVVSGLTFGLLIAAATFIALAQAWNWLLLLPCLQQVVSISLIMMTNNTCDIERDQEAGRRTLPVLLGRKRALALLAAGNLLALIALAVFALLLGWLYALPVIAVSFFVSRLLLRFSSLRFDAQDRPLAMQISTKLARALTIASCCVLLLAVFWH